MPSPPDPAAVEILGVPIDDLGVDEAVERILRPATGPARQVSFVNVDCVNTALADPDYGRILAGSALRLGDGVGLRLAARLLRARIPPNLNGTDLFPPLCQRMEREGLRLFLLGGRDGVPEGVQRWIASHHPRLQVAGTHHGYFAPEEGGQVVEHINGSGCDVLLVAFGVPLQEKWIAAHLPALRVRVALGVGGLFDFYSGRIRRAPRWLRAAGLEWAYRLAQEPRRLWRRYLVGIPLFLMRVVSGRLRAPARPPAKAVIPSR